MKFIKYIIALLTLFIFCTILFFGCKKNATTYGDQQHIEQTQLRELYRQKLEGQPFVSKEVLNLKGKAYYGDINGNPISRSSLEQHRELGSSCPDPSDTEADQVFESMEREFTCGVGYRFLVSYRITSEFYPVLGSSPNLSGGRVQLRNASNVVILTTAFAPLIHIQNNGVVGMNSNGDDMNEFIVTYRTGFVSEADYNAATSIRPNCLIYTDCPNIPTINILYSTQQSAEGSQHITQPCLRADIVGWSPAAGGSPPSLSGADPTGFTCFPVGYVFPHRQQVQFQNGSGVWMPFYLYTNGLANPSTETDLILHTDIWYIDVSTSQSSNGLVPGYIQVRYRNNLLYTSSNGGPCVTQPDDTWITETWYIN